MDVLGLQDRINKGMGVAARRVGRRFALYRPDGSAFPLDPKRRKLDLAAVFLPGSSSGIVNYGHILWRGIFDASYCRPGDYLVGEFETYFVAIKQLGYPVQCVLANRVVSIVRSSPAAQGGYSGFFATPGIVVLHEWPASLLESGGHAEADGLAQTRFGGWSLLLPPTDLRPQIADVVNDDLGGVYTVSSAEQSLLGWRLVVRQINS
jgi:hypothetical protein